MKFNLIAKFAIICFFSWFFCDLNVFASYTLIPIAKAHKVTELSAWEDLRKQFILEDASIQPEVIKQIDWLINNHKYFSLLSKRAQPYLHYIIHTINKNTMPGEIALLPMVESNFNPFAYSNAGAAGLWQIMPGTATGYGIKQNKWYDGRRDLIDSTKAAIGYLTYLYNFFNQDWLLALAAYNSGEGTVRQAIAKNKRMGLKTDFWSLSLPTETQIYVPRLLALVSIIKNPERYNVELPSFDGQPYFEIVEINNQLDLARIASITEISESELHFLNPGFNRWATPPYGTNKILLPIDKVEFFNKSIPYLSATKNTLKEHLIQKGDTLGELSKKYSVPIKSIKSINDLQTSHLYLGKKLKIPSQLYYHEGLTPPSLNKFVANTINNYGPKKVVHIIKGKDTLLTIAKKYNISAGAIEFWNKLAPNKPLPHGNKLIIWIPNKFKRFYTVKEGDNLSTIALKYGTTITELKKSNSFSKKHIQIGQKINLPV